MEEKDINNLEFKDWEELMIPEALSKPMRRELVQDDLFEQFEYMLDNIEE